MVEIGGVFVLRTGQTLTGRSRQRDNESLRLGGQTVCPFFHTLERIGPMKRKKSGSRAPSFEEAVDIWVRLLAGEYQHDIAASYGYNQGRIADVKSGRLHPDAKGAALEVWQKRKAG